MLLDAMMLLSDAPSSAPMLMTPWRILGRGTLLALTPVQERLLLIGGASHYPMIAARACLCTWSARKSKGPVTRSASMSLSWSPTRRRCR